MGASIPSKLRPSLVGYFDGLSSLSQAGNRADLSAHRRQWLSFLFFTLTTAFLCRTVLVVGCKTHLEEADIWQCLAKGSEPDLQPSLTLSASLLQCLLDPGESLIEGPLDFTLLQNSLLLVAQHRVWILLTAVRVVLLTLDLESS